MLRSQHEERLTGTSGTAAGGTLGAIFTFEMKGAEATCEGSGAGHEIAALVVYVHGMGMVVHCPSRESVLIRVTEIRERHRLDMRGVRVLHIDPTP